MRRTLVLIVLFLVMSSWSPAVAQESASTPSAGGGTPASGAPSAGNLIKGLFDIGGRSLYLSCEGTGSPTVILEAGASASSGYWVTLQDRIAELSRVCIYDRAGIGQSSAAREQAPSVESLAADLQALLEAAAVPGPYVLVAHSCGGLVIRQFAAAQPDSVAGLVMIDACSPQWLVETTFEPDWEAFLTGDNPEAVDYIAGAKALATLRMPDVPAAVLANWDGVNEFLADNDWIGWQAAMAEELGTVLIVLPGASHEIHLTRPNEVVDAIRGVLTAP